MNPRFLFTGLLACALAASLAAQSRLFPAPGAAGLPPDVQPKIRFDAHPVLSGHGAIRISEAGAGTVVETIDTAVPVRTQAIGGLGGFNYYPVTIDGNEATVHPRNGELAPGKTYEIAADAGVFRTGGQDSPAIEPGTWRFETRRKLPAPGAASLVIDAAGTGDFCTVQGALDFIPLGNTAPITLRLKPGVYTELVFFTDKHSITLTGENRDRCVVAYANNDKFNSGGGNPYATGGNPSSPALLAVHHVYHRGVFLAHRVKDFTISNLTIHNLTPHGGSQAEALILNGETDARARIEHVHLISYQDTVQINGQAYVHDSFIEGDVDFMWGTGPVYWSDCTCRAVNSKAYYTQVRNPPGRHGFVYSHCVIDGAPGVQGVLLSRIEPARFPASEVVFLNCTLGEAVAPVGWLLQHSKGDANKSLPDPAQVQFLEYGSRGPGAERTGQGVRLAASRRLTQTNDAALIAKYEQRAYVLGNGWNP